MLEIKKSLQINILDILILRFSIVRYKLLYHRTKVDLNSVTQNVTNI